MNKKPFAAAILILVAAAILQADWKTEVLDQLGTEKNYPAAMEFLRSAYASVSDEEKPDALAFLAFLCRKSGEAEEETRHVVDYFETYKDRAPMFDFLDEDLSREFVGYWGKWASLYPIITETVLLDSGRGYEDLPPAFLEIGMTLLNRALYKISGPDGPMEAGVLEPGFRIFRLPLGGDYAETGRIAYDLDLKTGSLIVRKRLVLEIDVRTMGGPLSTMKAPRINASEKIILRPVVGEVSLYVGDTLILTTKKLAAAPVPLNFKIPGPSAPGTKPYLAPPKDQIPFNQVSILDAISLAATAIKDLVKKKKHTAPAAPSYKKTDQLVFSFQKSGPEGENILCRSSISLKAENAFVLKN